MRRGSNTKGFSLVEVMMATGLLTIGFAFIAGLFPVGITLVASSVERSMGPVVAQEAFAKIRLYDIGTAPSSWLVPPAVESYSYPYGAVASAAFNTANGAMDVEYEYPSAATVASKNYSWSAICRYDAVDSEVDVTVFVCKKAARVKYRDPVYPLDDTMAQTWPQPIRLSVMTSVTHEDRMQRITSLEERDLIVEGSAIVVDETVEIYTVLKRNVINTSTVEFVLNGVFPGSGSMPPVAADVWVVPPAFGSGKDPCIWVEGNTFSF